MTANHRLLKLIRKLPLVVRLLIAMIVGFLPFVLWTLLLGVGLQFSLTLYVLCAVVGTVGGLQLHRKEERDRDKIDPTRHRGPTSTANPGDRGAPLLAELGFAASYRERRQEGWDRTVVWARAHPRTASLIPWSFVAGILAWTCFIVLDVMEGRWGAIAYYGPAIVLGVWTIRSWRRINRGEARPTNRRDR